MCGVERFFCIKGVFSTVIPKEGYFSANFFWNRNEDFSSGFFPGYLVSFEEHNFKKLNIGDVVELRGWI